MRCKQKEHRVNFSVIVHVQKIQRFPTHNRLRDPLYGLLAGAGSQVESSTDLANHLMLFVLAASRCLIKLPNGSVASHHDRKVCFAIVRRINESRGGLR